MGEALVIFTQDEGLLPKLERQWASMSRNVAWLDSELTFQYMDGAFWVSRGDDDAIDYGDDTIKAIEQMMPGRRCFYYIRYTNFDALRSLMCRTEFPSDVIVDDDHGRLAPLPRFLEDVQRFGPWIPMRGEEDESR